MDACGRLGRCRHPSGRRKPPRRSCRVPRQRRGGAACSRPRSTGRYSGSDPVLASSTKAIDDSLTAKARRRPKMNCCGSRTRRGAMVAIYRLPNVFGKWCRPNYNSAVATFCHNIARGLPIRVNDPAAPLSLVYVDDLVDALSRADRRGRRSTGFREVEPGLYETRSGRSPTSSAAFAQDRDEPHRRCRLWPDPRALCHLRLLPASRRVRL